MSKRPCYNRRLSAFTYASIGLALSLIMGCADAAYSNSGERQATHQEAQDALQSSLDKRIQGPSNRPADALTPNEKEIHTDKASPIPKKDLVLALGGGACKGMAQIGVLKELERNGIKCDAIVGTSMGATIGALYSAGYSPDEIEKFFRDHEIQEGLQKGTVIRIFTWPFRVWAQIFKGKPYAGFNDGKAYHKFLQKTLPSDFSDCKIPFSVVATNLTTGKVELLNRGDLPTAVLASNAVPMFFKPVEIDGDLYVDGGLGANLPTKAAEALGAKKIIAVLVDGAIKPVSNERFKSNRSTIYRVVDILLANLDKDHLRDADILIYPNVDDIGAITVKDEDISKAIEAGRKAAIDAIPKLIMCKDIGKP